MRIFKLLRLPLAVALLLLPLSPARAQGGKAAAELLPSEVGEFRASGAPDFISPAVEPLTLEDFSISAHVGREYVAPDGRRFDVYLIRTDTASAAYSFLTFNWEGAKGIPFRFGDLRGLGYGALTGGGLVRFINGTSVVNVHGTSPETNNQESPLAFARLLAEKLGGGPGEHPVLVLHLPEWEKKVVENVGHGVGYAVSRPALQQAAGRRPVLDVIDFEGGAEAATATYGDSRLVVVEFTTPQHSVDADAAVNRRINELRAAGEPVPTLYRREGNYSVFVFDAPDAAAAEQLAGGVKYEKDVRWLGRNPHADEIMARRYTQKMGGVILTTLITTGLAILLCLGIGGALGGAVFLYRRARTGEQEVFTDAGGMQRLNLEDLNTPPASVRLLKQAEE